MSDTPGMDRDAEAAARAGREPRQGPPPLDDAFREIQDAGREGLSAALDTGRALRGLLIADLALARSALGRALMWVSVAIVFGASSWLLLMAALIALLQGVLGWSWLASMSTAAGLSLIVTGIGGWQALRCFEYTRLSATRRQLRRLGLGHEEDDDDREIDRPTTEAR